MRFHHGIREFASPGFLLSADMASAGTSTSVNEPITKVVAVPQAPATVQKPRRRSDLNLDAVPAPKRKRPEVGTDPDALRSRGFEFFDVKIIETKVPQTGKYSGNFTSVTLRELTTTTTTQAILLFATMNQVWKIFMSKKSASVNWKIIWVAKALQGTCTLPLASLTKLTYLF